MAKTLLGLDIGTHSIKAVQLIAQKDQVTLLSAGYIATPVNDLSTATQAEEQAVGKSINRLMHDMKISTSEVAFSLPSSKVVTRVIEVPFMTEKELLSSIQWEIEPYVPFPMDKVKLDYAVIAEDSVTKKMKLLLVAAPIALIERYMRVVAAAGLVPVAVETEMLSITRSIAQNFKTITNILVMNMGATTTEIGLLHNHMMIYTKSYPVGGNTLTRAISDELGFESVQAEEYKKTYGLEEEKLEGKIAKILMPFFTNIFTELEKTVAYFKEQYAKEEIMATVLCGGGSKLPGLMLSVTKHLGLDCQTSNPFTNITVDSSVLPIIMPDAPQYTTAVGLAMKEIE